MQNTTKYYESLVKTQRNYKQMTISFLQAFFFGGLLCLFGQVILTILNLFFSPNESNFYLLIIIISLAAILSAVGIYDDMGQIAKCGLAIPISGFSNACVSAAMEYKKEGLVLGIGSNCLKLAGSVILYGILSAFILVIVRVIISG